MPSILWVMTLCEICCSLNLEQYQLGQTCWNELCLKQIKWIEFVSIQHNLPNIKQAIKWDMSHSCLSNMTCLLSVSGCVNPFYKQIVLGLKGHVKLVESLVTQLTIFFFFFCVSNIKVQDLNPSSPNYWIK